MPVQEFLNWVVLIGAGVMALWNILKALGVIKKSTSDRVTKQIKDVLEEEAPGYFDKYTQSQQELRDKRVKELTAPMADAVCDIFNDRFDKIEMLLGQQTKQMEELSDKVEALQDQNSDLLRRELKKIYHKYRPYKKIPQYDYDDCQQMMNDYTGNSYAEDMWERIKQFEVVEDDDFLDIRERGL